MAMERMTAGPRIKIPVIRTQQLDLASRKPELIRALQNNPERLVIAFDIDNTMLTTDRTQPQVTTTFSNRPILYEIARHLRRGTTIALISGNDIAEQKPRTVKQIEKYFEATHETELLRSLVMYGMKGGNRISFDDIGKERVKEDADYNRKNKIPKTELSGITKAISTALAQKPASELKGKEKPGIDYRPKKNPVQIAVRKFSDQGVRSTVTAQIIGQMALIDKALAEAFNVMPAGSTTIDIDQKRIDKGSTLAKISEDRGLTPADTIVFFGDELKLTSNSEGLPIWGNDLAALKAANVIAMAVNTDQSTVVDHSRVIRAGSGPLATLNVLQYFSLVSETMRNVPKGTEIKFPACVVPVIEKEEIELPKAVKEMDFNSSAVFLRINTLMTDPVTGKYLEQKDRPTGESTVMVSVIRLLMKDVRVVLMTGDSGTKQQKKVVDQIFELIKSESKLDPDKISNLSLIANNGASRTSFFNNNGQLDSVEDAAYFETRKIETDKFAALKDLMGKALEKYRSELKVMANRGDREAMDYLGEFNDPANPMLEERDGEAQLSLVRIMPALRETIYLKIAEKLREEGLSDQYTVRMGGSRAVNINRSTAGFKQAVSSFLKDNGLSTALYLGAEFFHKVSEVTGSVISGNDMELLSLKEIIALGLNPVQEEVKALKTDRVIAGGSGADAANTWLNFIADNIEDRRRLRDPK